LTSGDGGLSSCCALDGIHPHPASHVQDVVGASRHTCAEAPG
jgi:hypothetical protein